MRKSVNEEHEVATFPKGYKKSEKRGKKTVESPET